MAERVQAAVRTGPSRTEFRDYPMPDIAADGALLKMEVAGICGTDVKLYKTPPSSAPVIMGHENIGVIAKAGSEFTRRKGFKEGDLVFVEHYVTCGRCEWCYAGQYRHCENTDWRTNPDGIRYGYTSAERAPHLWGGFAQYVYLPWNAVVHRVPKGVTPELLHLEYLEQHPNGVRYTTFCDRYRAWTGKRGLSMRQVHVAGDKAFVDFSGTRPVIVDRATGEVTAVCVTDDGKGGMAAQAIPADVRAQLQEAPASAWDV